MVPLKSGVREKVIYVVEHGMSVCPRGTERIHRNPSESIRGPKRSFQRKLDTKTRIVDTWVELLEIGTTGYCPFF